MKYGGMEVWEWEYEVYTIVIHCGERSHLNSVQSTISPVDVATEGVYC